MSNANEPAYPPTHDPKTHPFGLTKREVFAMMAMQVMIPVYCNATKSELGTEQVYRNVPILARRMADALLAELEKK